MKAVYVRELILPNMPGIWEMLNIGWTQEMRLWKDQHDYFQC